jgi:Fe-S-cluster-containing dehydrogenase component
MEKHVFIFDQNRCVGCEACVVACLNENGALPRKDWRRVTASNPLHVPGLPLLYLSMACNHCDDAPCKQHCPALAFQRDEHTGAILQDPERCIGCTYCSWACPYDAPVPDPRSGTIAKCDFCTHRLREGKKPACANLCPTGALDATRKNFSREEAFRSSPVQVRVGSSLEILPPGRPAGPVMDASLYPSPPKREKKDRQGALRQRTITARQEWPLVVFSLLTAIMVALTVDLSGEAHLAGVFPGHYRHWLVAGTGLLAMLFSFLHLGKKTRAWRAVLNIRESWLSREIVLLILFMGAVGAQLAGLPVSPTLPIVLGLLLLFSLDQIYRLVQWEWPSGIHSAQTLFMAFSMALLLSPYPWFFLAIALARSLLYLYRKTSPGGIRVRPWSWSVLRLAGLAGAALLILPGISPWIALPLFLAGELLDRVEFYDELSLPSLR